MKTLNQNQNAPSHEDIRKLAYLLWENDGRPQGRDLEFWLRAEAQAKPASSAPGIAQPKAQAPTSSAEVWSRPTPRATILKVAPTAPVAAKAVPVKKSVAKPVAKKAAR